MEGLESSRFALESSYTLATDPSGAAIFGLVVGEIHEV
jgi:hypothetical protein